MRSHLWWTKFFIWFSVVAFKKTDAYFGLSAPYPLSEEIMSTDPSSASSLGRLGVRALCRDVLHVKGNVRRKECRRNINIALILVDAVKQSLHECMNQFRYELWDCNPGSVRMKLLKGAFRETSFLFAVTSASLMHGVAKGCSKGRLTQCTCDTSESPEETRQTWKLRGCGDNVPYAKKFTRRFLFGYHRKKRKRSDDSNYLRPTRSLRYVANDIQALVERHNANAGIQAVLSSVHPYCKCHGVSGSCTTKTCWKQVANFRTIGSLLKERYHEAVHHDPKWTTLLNTGYSSTINSTNKKRRRKQPKQHQRSSRFNTASSAKNTTFSLRYTLSSKHVKPNELVYLSTSPDFCSLTGYVNGSKQRECGTKCNEICCGRGYDNRTVVTSERHNCTFKWCCESKCNERTRKISLYFCKSPSIHVSTN